MKINRNQNYTPVKLEDLKYGDVFEYDGQIYTYMSPKNIQTYCRDTTPVFCPLTGLILYLSKTTIVIYYPNAELCLGNAYKG